MENRLQSVSETFWRCQRYRQRAWASTESTDTRARQLLAMLKFGMDASTAAKATADVATRSLDTSRSTA
jgi:hypothetical protein